MIIAAGQIAAGGQIERTGTNFLSIPIENLEKREMDLKQGYLTSEIRTDLYFISETQSSPFDESIDILSKYKSFSIVFQNEN